MGMFKLVFLAAVAFFSAIAIFIGGVTILTSLQNGAISIGYTSGGKPVSETISKVADAGRFWQLMLTMGGLPVVIGAVAMWYSIRKLRGH